MVVAPQIERGSEGARNEGGKEEAREGGDLGTLGKGVLGGGERTVGWFHTPPPSLAAQAISKAMV
jgi:hypothetical protein